MDEVSDGGYIENEGDSLETRDTEDFSNAKREDEVIYPATTDETSRTRLVRGTANNRCVHKVEIFDPVDQELDTVSSKTLKEIGEVIPSAQVKEDEANVDESILQK